MPQLNTQPLRSIHRPMIVMAVAVVTGIAIGYGLPGHLWWAGCGLLLFTALMLRDILLSRPGLAWPVLFSLLAGYVSIQPWLINAVPENHVSRFAGDHKWRISGTIIERPKLNNGRWRFVLAADDLAADRRHYVTSGRVLVSGRGHWPGAGRGDRVVFFAKLRTIRGFANPGGFDYERYMTLHAVRARAYAKSGTLHISSRNHQLSWRGCLDRYRGQLADRLEKAVSGFPQPTIQLLKALLIGEKDHLPNQVRQAFNRAGVGHVLAISGLHIGMVATVAFAVTQWTLAWIPLMLRRAWTRKGAALLSLGPVLAYGLLAGLSASTQRAMVMVAVFLMGYWVGRRHDLFNTLSIAGLIILIICPPALLGISFQLSFTAVMAIFTGLAVRPVRPPGFDARQWRRLWGRMVLFVRVSLLAVLGTLPLVLYYFNQVSIVGLAVNLVVVPVVGTIIVPAGLAGVAATTLNADLAVLLWRIAAMAMDLVRITVAYVSRWPWSAVQCVTPTVYEICLFYLLGAILLCWKWVPRPKKALAVVLVLAALDAGSWIYQRYGCRQLRVTAIDVGQGTANLLQFPGGYTALIDGGGFSDNASFDVGAKIVAPLLWRKKIAAVDLVALSHANSDHLNGLLYILEHFKVKEVWSNGEGSPTFGFRQWERLITAFNVHHLDRRDLPAMKVIHGVQLKVMAPPPGFMQRAALEPWRDLNNNSLVLRVCYRDISFLFTGDIMAAAEKQLVDRHGRQALQSTILVVAHHGSQHSSTVGFLDAVQPKEALISAGWRNRFGFPHPDAMQRLAGIGARTWSTADSGAIQVVTDGKRYRIETCRQGPLSR